jgi:hypothetical protein
MLVSSKEQMFQGLTDLALLNLLVHGRDGTVRTSGREEANAEKNGLSAARQTRQRLAFIYRHAKKALR